MCSFLNVLPEVLLLVSGEVYKVPQQERLHHGEHNILIQPFIPTMYTHYIHFVWKNELKKHAFL